MKRLSLGAATQSIALLFMTAAVLPLHAQDVNTPAKVQVGPEHAGETLEQSEAKKAQHNGRVDSSQTKASQAKIQTYTFPTPKERFNRYVKSTVGAFSLARTAISAGIAQWRDSPEEWEQGASGYGKRFASGFGKNAIQQTVVYGMDSALGLDTGFRRSTQKGFGPRVKDAMIENITSRTRTGKRVISAPRLAGIYTSRIIAYETWYPERYSYKDGLRSGTRTLLLGFGMNLIREFVVRF